MRSAARSFTLGAVACALLSAPSGAAAQSGGAAPPDARGASDKPAQPATSAEAGAAKDPAATTEAGEAAAQAPPEKPSVTGGYSWSDAPRKAAKKRRAPRATRVDRNAPTATFPGFRPLQGGGSVVWVSVSKEVPVKPHVAPGRVVYLLEGARVQAVNNTHPLVTTHFNTPAQSIRLVPVKAGVELVVELREAIKPVHRVVRGPRGMMLLELELPPPTRPYAVRAAVPPLEVRSGSAPQRQGGRR